MRSLNIHVEHGGVPLAYVEQEAVPKFKGLPKLSISIDEHNDMETWNPRFLQPRHTGKAVVNLVINTKDSASCFREQRSIALEIAFIKPRKTWKV